MSFGDKHIIKYFSFIKTRSEVKYMLDKEATLKKWEASGILDGLHSNLLPETFNLLTYLTINKVNGENEQRDNTYEG